MIDIFMKKRDSQSLMMNPPSASEIKDDATSIEENKITDEEYNSSSWTKVFRLIQSNYVGYTQMTDNTESEIENQISTGPQPKSLSWVNITCKFTLTQDECGPLSCCRSKRKETTKIILDNVTGIAKARAFLAVIGSSGSGKTSLLNCLTKRNLGSLKVEGRIYVNEDDAEEDIHKISGYIQQDDIFIGTMTVREHLWFNAVLRLNKSLSDVERRQRVDHAMNQMGLRKCENTIIGWPGKVKGISGGEKKRLAFAAELITRPSILFCDEPTSGLDSFTANSVISALKDLANKGHTVIATIHQPSSEIFAMFDEILIMAEGRVAFLGSKNDAVTFFSKLGYQCPQNYNVADFFIQELAVIRRQEKQCKDKIRAICRSFEKSSYWKAINQQIPKKEYSGSSKLVLQKDSPIKWMLKRQQYQASWHTQVAMCLWRSQIELKRNKEVQPAKLLQISLLSLLIGAIFWQQPYNSTGSENINSALFMMMLQTSLNVYFIPIVRDSAMFPILVKEHYDGQYSVGTFCLAVLLIEIPFLVLICFVYVLLNYWLIGLYPDAGTFFTMGAALSILSCFASTLGHLCASIFIDAKLAALLLSALSWLQIFFSGNLLKYGTSPSIFKFMEDLSVYRYTYQILIISQWKNVEHLECEYSSENGSQSEGFISNLDQVESILCYDTGLELIESFGYETDSVVHCFGIMIVLLIAVQLIYYISLVFKIKSAK